MATTQAAPDTHAWSLPFEQHHRLALTVEYGRVTIEALMERFEVSRNTVLNYIAGRTSPPPTTVEVWAGMAKVSELWLKKGVGRPGDEPDGGSTQGVTESACIRGPWIGSYDDALLTAA